MNESEAQQASAMDVDDNNEAEAVQEDARMDVVQPEVSNVSASPVVASVVNQQQNNNTRVMASSGTIGSVSISLHPLVIMNVSEHWTRLRAQEGSDQLGKCIINL